MPGTFYCNANVLGKWSPKATVSLEEMPNRCKTNEMLNI